MMSRVWHFFVPLLLGIILALCFVQADPVEVHARREVQRRQARQTGNGTDITTSSTPTVIPTTSSSNPPTSSAADSATSAVESSSSPISSVDTLSITTPITSLSKSIRTFTTGVVTTVDGVATTIPATFTSATDVPVTLMPGLQEDTTSGLSDNSKKIVIGVIVGVVGAAVLAGIAVVVWRHMKKERDRKESSTANLTYFGDEDPAEGYGAAPSEGVVGSEKSRSPVRSPPVNAAANF